MWEVTVGKLHDELRSLGEAHCYLAVIKADGTVSGEERARAPLHARRAHTKYNMFGGSSHVAARASRDVRQMLSDPAYTAWEANQHLDKGIELLRRAAKAGSRGIDISADRLEAELYEVAYLDGYNLRESRYVKKVLGRLRELG